MFIKCLDECKLKDILQRNCLQLTQGVVVVFSQKKAKKNSETQIGEIKIYSLEFITFINVW